MIYNTLTRWGLILLVLSGISACSTTEQALKSMSGKWIGQRSDQFVLQYGSPTGDSVLTNGDHILRWGLSSKARIPGGPAHSRIPSEGVAMMLECNFEMVVAGNGVIKSIRILRDTTGRWQTSRCNEIFGKPRT